MHFSGKSHSHPSRKALCCLQGNREADLRPGLNEIISLTFVPLSRVSSVSTEGATGATKRPFHAGWGTQQAVERSQSFFPKVLTKHLGLQGEKMNAFCIKNDKAQLMIRHRVFLYLFSDSEHFLFVNTHMVDLISLTCKNTLGLRVFNVSYLRYTQMSKA